MNLYRAGAITDDVYAACDANGNVIPVADFALSAPDALGVVLGDFEAGVGFHFTVEPDVSLAGATGEIVASGTGWRDVIAYRVVDVLAETLCTCEQVKSRGGIKTDGADAQIQDLIDVVLPTVNERYGCEFMPQVAETRTFEFSGSLCELTGCDLASATSVVLDPNGTPQTLVVGIDYVLRTRRLTGTAVALQLAEPVDPGRFGRAELAITGTWGIWATVDEVPPHIQQAAVECVLSWKDRTVASIPSLDGDAPRQMLPTAPSTWDIPAGAHRKFQPYSRNLGVY